MAEFPRLPLSPGSYAAEWFLEGRTLPGELQVEPGIGPTIALFGDVDEVDYTRAVEFPRDRNVPVVNGRLRSGENVSVSDVTLWTWFPGRTSGFGRFAVVGLGAGEAVDNKYLRARLQITEADLFFGAGPIKSVSWPTDSSLPLQGKYTVETNPTSSHEWTEDKTGIHFECGYDVNFSISDTHRHELNFAPVIGMTSLEPLTVDDWIRQWVTPLLRVASLATLRPQRLSWLTVHTAAADSDPDDRAHHVTGVVFGGGIQQVPYQAEYRAEWHDPERHPLFTLAGLPVGLPVLLRGWRDLERGENPFIELYGLALRQEALPQRARFLYLVQALEALHAAENRARDAKADADFAVSRTAAMADLAAADLPPQTVKFMKKYVSAKRPDSLDSRLTALIGQLPEPVGESLRHLDMGAIQADLVIGGASTLPAQLRVLRNNLSHGTRNYRDRELLPWVAAVEMICRAQALRLLGFDTDGIVRAIIAPSTAP
jgi:ApeA N-terminal domain 1